MKCKTKFILAAFILISTTCLCQKAEFAVNEKSEIKLFNEFKNYLVSHINQNKDFFDSSNFNYVIEKYFFTNTQKDSVENGKANILKIPPQKLDLLKRTVNDFYNYFMGHKNENLAENLSAIPIRISKDTFIFNRLTAFQKENTFVFFDKRKPDQTLGYMLFIPPIKNINSKTKIWSWSLGFKFGKFYFTSLTGEEGYEYMFDIMVK